MNVLSLQIKYLQIIYGYKFFLNLSAPISLLLLHWFYRSKQNSFDCSYQIKSIQVCKINVKSFVKALSLACDPLWFQGALVLLQPFQKTFTMICCCLFF